LIGMESSGNCQWFVEMATRLEHDVWIGDAAKIRASDSRQQKHDRRDAALILKLLLEGRFPRIWVPSGEEKDLRQLLIHLYKLVRLRAQVKNELQYLAMNQGVTRKRKLWRKAGEKVLPELPLRPWASRRWRGNWRFDSTGCCEPIPGIQRSFVSRAARGCRWSAQARPKG
jgi:transposase